MNTFLKALVILVIVIAAAAGGVYYYLFQAGDSEPLEQFAPADAFAYIEISNTRQTALDFARNTHKDAIAESGRMIAGLFASAAGDIDEIDFSKVDTEVLAKLAFPFNRQVSMWMPEIDWDDEEPRLRLPLMIAHFQGDPSSFEENLQTFTNSLNAAAPSDDAPLTWKKTDWNGMEIRTLDGGLDEELKEADLNIDPPSPSWTIWEGRLVASLSEKTLKDYLGSIDDLKAEESFAMDEFYQATSESDLIALLDFSSILKAFEKFSEDSPLLKGASNIPLDDILEATGIMEFETLSYGLDLSGGELSSYSALSFDENKGMLKLISPSSESNITDFAPAESDIVNSFNMDFGETILFIKELVFIANPQMAAMYGAYKPTADQFVGMDVETLLDEAFSPEMHIFYELEPIDPNSINGPNPMPGVKSQVFALGMNDAKVLRELLESNLAPLLAQMPNLLSQKEIAGNQYYVLNAPQSPVMSFLIRDDYALIGMGAGAESSLFENALQNLASGKQGMFAENDFAKIVDLEDPNLVGIAAFDIQEYFGLIKSLAEVMGTQAKATGDTTISDAIDSINWKILESMNAYAVSTTTKTDHLFVSTTKVVSK